MATSPGRRPRTDHNEVNSVEDDDLAADDTAAGRIADHAKGG
ncbi:hypothetical protein [Dactylosporangium darangshiense]